MTEIDPRLGRSRDLVARVLAGEITQDNAREMFEDDVVLIAIRIVEKCDPDWLLGRLADGTLPFAGRLQVLRDLSGLFDRALDLLRVERPDLTPDLEGTRFTS